jgi:predicted amidophosphoribosyltransferase
MCRWGVEIATRGRPICGNCGEPIDPEGHFCPKRNGHKH